MAAAYGVCCRDRPFGFLDIGARRGVAGSYRLLEKLGILSVVLVEADEQEAAQLQVKFPTSKVIHAALGGSDEIVAELRLTANPDMSSLLEPLPLKGETGESLEVVDRIPVKISRLESVWPNRYEPPCFVKLDVQGYELEALKGMESMLPGVVAMEVEVRLERHYEEQPLIQDILDFMQARGFYLVGLKPNGFKDQTRMVVFNAFFMNSDYSESSKAKLWKKLNNIGTPRRLRFWGY